jgi:hypothetical protein
MRLIEYTLKGFVISFLFKKGQTSHSSIEGVIDHPTGSVAGTSRHAAK